MCPVSAYQLEKIETTSNKFSVTVKNYGSHPKPSNIALSPEDNSTQSSVRQETADPVRGYLIEIGRIPLLTPEQEISLGNWQQLSSPPSLSLWR